MLPESSSVGTVLIFYSYAFKDHKFLAILDKHMSVLKRQGRVQSWHRESIRPGDERQRQIDEQLSKANIILLLISADYVSSDYCYHVEMRQAIAQHRAGKSLVVPIILRSIDWEGLPFEDLHSLPRDDREGVKALNRWRDRDAAVTAIVKELKHLIEQFTARRLPSAPLTSDLSYNSDRSALWSVPHPLDPHFPVKQEQLERIHQLCLDEKSASPTILAITGADEFAKTQTALAYAHRYREHYQAVFWLEADSHASLITSFISLADVLDLPARSTTDQQQTLAAVHTWFQQHTGWLLILNNVADIVSASMCIPAAGEGNVLITYCGQTMSADIKTIELVRMEPDEGALLLLQRAKIIGHGDSLQKASTAQLSDARAIVELVGGDPLALNLAGAYMRATSTGLAAYQRIYKASIAHHLHHSQEATSLNAVTSICSLSLQECKSSDPAAFALLQLCAFLHPAAIPEELFKKGAADFDPPLQSLASNARKLHTAINALRRYSLVEHESESHSLVIHPLVQLVLRDEMNNQEQRRWAECAIRVVNRTFPVFDYNNRSRCQRYLPHALACSELIKRWQLELPEAVQLLNKAGAYLYERAQYNDAQALYQQALTMCEQGPGSQSLEAAQALHYLGRIARKHTNYSIAQYYYERALAIRERESGGEDAETAQTLNDLGELAQSQKRYEQAGALYRRALSIRERTLGHEDADTISSLGDIAGIAEELHDYKQVEHFYEEACRLSEQYLGPENAHTAIALSKLARFYRARKKYEQAEPLFTKALAIIQRALEPNHPEIGTLLNNFALLYRDQDRYAQAEQFLKQAIVIWNRSLGADHLHTGTGLKNLAKVYRLQKDFERAENFYRRALAIFINKLGPDHDNTIAVREDLLATQREAREKSAKDHTSSPDTPA